MKLDVLKNHVKSRYPIPSPSRWGKTLEKHEISRFKKTPKYAYMKEVYQTS
jgi:hypothetical protein